MIHRLLNTECRGGVSKTQLLNLEARKFSLINKLHVFECMGKINIVWNFKWNLWNSTQNILPIHWKRWILFSVDNLGTFRFTSSLTFNSENGLAPISWQAIIIPPPPHNEVVGGMLVSLTPSVCLSVQQSYLLCWELLPARNRKSMGLWHWELMSHPDPAVLPVGTLHSLEWFWVSRRIFIYSHHNTFVFFSKTSVPHHMSAR